MMRMICDGWEGQWERMATAAGARSSVPNDITIRADGDNRRPVNQRIEHDTRYARPEHRLDAQGHLHR